MAVRKSYEPLAEHIFRFFAANPDRTAFSDAASERLFKAARQVFIDLPDPQDRACMMYAHRGENVFKGVQQWSADYKHHPATGYRIIKDAYRAFAVAIGLIAGGGDKDV